MSKQKNGSMERGRAKEIKIAQGHIYAQELIPPEHRHRLFVRDEQEDLLFLGKANLEAFRRYWRTRERKLMAEREELQLLKARVVDASNDRILEEMMRELQAHGAGETCAYLLGEEMSGLRKFSRVSALYRGMLDAETQTTDAELRQVRGYIKYLTKLKHDAAEKPAFVWARGADYCAEETLGRLYDPMFDLTQPLAYMYTRARQRDGMLDVSTDNWTTVQTLSLSTPRFFSDAEVEQFLDGYGSDAKELKYIDLWMMQARAEPGTQLSTQAAWAYRNDILWSVL